MEKKHGNFKILSFFLLFSFIFYFVFTTCVYAIEDKVQSDEKIAFLTFDDGPTENTKNILKVLEENQVPATFFIIGQQAEYFPHIMETIKSKGHSICVHTYSHDKSIYKSSNSYIADYKKCKKVIDKYMSDKSRMFMRFPGGSSTAWAPKSTLRGIRSSIIEEGVYYVDWNVSLEDAISPNRPVNVLLKNFNHDMKGKEGPVVVLMHDSAYTKTTVYALPTVIKTLKDKGYTFKNMDSISDKDIELLMKNRIINRYNPTIDKEADKSVTF